MIKLLDTLDFSVFIQNILSLTATCLFLAIAKLTTAAGILYKPEANIWVWNWPVASFMSIWVLQDKSQPIQQYNAGSPLQPETHYPCRGRKLMLSVSCSGGQIQMNTLRPTANQCVEWIIWPKNENWLTLQAISLISFFIRTDFKTDYISCSLMDSLEWMGAKTSK